MIAADIALRAADLISERGHCKHTSQDDEGRLCFSGAVKTALGENPYYAFDPTWFNSADPCREEKISFFIEIFSAAHRILGILPVDYNDDPQTSGEDVILLLKRIAEELT
jgi:hypothetical protein